MSPWWRRRSIVIPPETPEEWLRLAAWELWMGMLLFLLIAVGVWLISTAPERLVTVRDLSPCWATPPAPDPCARTLYRGGLNMIFSAFAGVMMLSIAAWCLWALWTLAEPRPITDDFLRLLSDSFGRDWRNPMTWPWARLLWAYGFTAIGAALTAGGAIGIVALVLNR